MYAITQYFNSCSTNLVCVSPSKTATEATPPVVGVHPADEDVARLVVADGDARHVGQTSP